MTDLKHLRERVEAATGRLDDELLGRVICAVLGKPFLCAEIGCGDDGSDELTVFCDDGGWAWRGYRDRAPDASLDAALALVERVLPGWDLALGRLEGNEPYEWFVSLGHGPELSAKTPALALLLAMLSALIERGDGHE